MEIFRSGLDLNIYRWMIISNKLWSSFYTSDASRASYTAPTLIIPKILNFKKNSMEISNFSRSVFVSPFFCRFAILLLSTVGQILNDSRHYVEVLYAPSATCGSWLYQSQNRVLSIGVFVCLLYNHLCYAPSVCSVYSSNPRAMFAFAPTFVFVNWSKIVKVFLWISRRHLG